jgi:hypothetical protein
MIYLQHHLVAVPSIIDAEYPTTSAIPPVSSLVAACASAVGDQALTLDRITVGVALYVALKEASRRWMRARLIDTDTVVVELPAFDRRVPAGHALVLPAAPCAVSARRAS